MALIRYLLSGLLQKALFWSLALGVALSGAGGSLLASTRCPGENTSESGRTDARNCCCSDVVGGCCATECCAQQNPDPMVPQAPVRTSPQKDAQDASILSFAQQFDGQDNLVATAEHFLRPFGGNNNFSLQSQHVRIQA